MNDRPTWPTTWMNFSKLIAQRSSDNKLKVGCVIVNDDNTSVLSVGYNGSPHGFDNERTSLEDGKSFFVHAEANCAVKMDYHHPCKKYAYITHSSCPDCARLLIQARIKRVIYDIPFRDLSGLDILRQGNIEVYTTEEADALAKEKRW